MSQRALDLARLSARLDNGGMKCLLVGVVSASSLVAQAAWTSLVPPASPTSRTEVQMHSDGQGALLFGGLNGPIQTSYDELWRFDGSAWSLQVPAGASPPPRARFAAAFDPIRQRLVVFGGDGQYTPNPTYGDTWEWDPAASSWIQLTPATQPTPRIHARLAYDLLNARMLMFGGSGAAATETWAWDGTDWTQLSPATAPPGRQQTHLATNWTNGQILMFGGSTGAGSGVLGDTWLWDGLDWSQIATATTPGGTGIRNGKIDYDRVRDRFVLFGGVRGSGGFSDSVWEFDGVDWSERLPAPGPAGRAGPGFCYVENLETSVLFGGYNGGFFADTWTYQTDAVASLTTSGVGCPSSAGVPSLTVNPLPWLGETVSFAIANTVANGLPLLLVGVSDAAWAGGSLPFNLGVLGYPACNLLVSPDTSTFAPAPVGLPIPTSVSLAGAVVHAQGAVLEPLAQGFDLAMSEAVRLAIGAR